MSRSRAHRSVTRPSVLAFSIGLVSLFAIGGGPAIAAETAAAASKPNVLLIAIDDLNDWVAVLGGHPQAKTPHIDALARRGVLFHNAHCQAPVCTPSRASLVTGLLPSTTGLYFLQPHIPASAEARKSVTLAERFAAEGYRTLGVGKIYGGGDGKNFQEYGGSMGGFGPRPKTKLNYPIGHPLWDWGEFPSRDDQMPDMQIADWAIERLKQKHDKPFFLAVGFYRPHVPLYVPAKWFKEHPLEAVKLPATKNDDRADLPDYAKRLTIGHPAPRHEWFLENDQWKRAVQSYLASSTFVDHCVGRVLKALRESPHAKNTIVVLFSDHGWHLGEKQRWAKRSLWEDSTRVPLVIALPGDAEASQPRICRRPVGLIDIYPTLLDLCGAAPDKAHEGHSLRPLLADPAAAWPHAAITTFGRGNHTVKGDRFRYIRYVDGSEELYDHESDPHEWNNLAADPKLAEVKKRLAEFLPKNERPIMKRHGSSGLKAYLDAEK